MADPHALTMSRETEPAVGGSPFAYPRRIRPWAVPACPLAVSRTGKPAGRTYTHHQNRVRSRSGAPSGLTHRGQARCDRPPATAGEALYAVQGIAKGRSSCRSLARPRSRRQMRKTSVRRTPSSKRSLRVNEPLGPASTGLARGSSNHAVIGRSAHQERHVRTFCAARAARGSSTKARSPPRPTVCTIMDGGMSKANSRCHTNYSL
jgi:hypothetical protein